MFVHMTYDTDTHEPQMTVTFPVRDDEHEIDARVRFDPSHQCDESDGCGEVHPPLWVLGLRHVRGDDDSEDRDEYAPTLELALSPTNFARIVAMCSVSLSEQDPQLLADALDWVKAHSSTVEGQ